MSEATEQKDTSIKIPVPQSEAEAEEMRLHAVIEEKIQAANDATDKLVALRLAHIKAKAIFKAAKFEQQISQGELMQAKNALTTWENAQRSAGKGRPRNPFEALFGGAQG